VLVINGRSHPYLHILLSALHKCYSLVKHYHAFSGFRFVDYVTKSIDFRMNINKETETSSELLDPVWLLYCILYCLY